ncbi:alkaline phosphatase [Vibrio parahaemolyticus]|uniref:alkaline phosphatase n=1 Tax=Vibrio parahaemolyticus TaxID=670 RepID=UPI000448F47F|nr:alkaline phosphatase [Vibrio parahaemolyticus]EXJ27492.1 cold-active alkaline phosphatase [Vibrio parahaemolyticus VPCR-2009]
MTIRYSLLAASLLAGFVHANEAPKNIIYMIGDGMGPAYTTAYRYYQDNPETKQIEPTVFDTILVGMAHTYPDDDTYVTDSAAGATALSSGIKSYNGAVAVDTHKKPVKTMLEVAKEQGMTTALVATSQINHATPASFAAHNESRRNYDQIADDYLDNKVNGKLPVDLLLGGGVRYFEREDRNLIEEFKMQGYHYLTDFDTLPSLQTLPAIGLFADKAFPFALDDNPNRLEKMTNKALSLLSRSEHGFFVMIEGSQIDWCGHANDIACAMAEMDDFAKSIALAKAYVDAHPDTLLVVTADHSTGGLTIGANGQYDWKTDVIKGVHQTAWPLATSLAKGSYIKQVWSESVDWALSDVQFALLTDAKKSEEPAKALYQAVKSIINDQSLTGWTTKGHTAVDVQVFAYGKGSQAFVGSQNNTDIANKLIGYLQ